MKKFLILFLLAILFISSIHTTNASALVTVTKDGFVRSNVLGDSVDAKAGAMKVQTLLSGVGQLADTTLSIIKEGEKSVLSVTSGSNTKQQNVTKLGGNIVEIIQDQSPKTITIGNVDQSFGISQSGITALTSFPIHINSKNKTISITTNSGERTISVLPDDAVETLIRANIINILSKDGQVVLGEGENGELTYLISAQKEINLFNIHTVLVAIDTTVSATSGKVLNVRQPQWLKIFGFLFS